jgi:hypothetical protein
LSNERRRRDQRINMGTFATGPAPVTGEAPPKVEEPPAPPPINCMHGAPPGACVFKGCAYYRADGPRDEKWAFAPGVTQADIDAALLENMITHGRAPGSASPIHLVVNRKVGDRLAREAEEAAAKAAPTPSETPPTDAAPVKKD